MLMHPLWNPGLSTHRYSASANSLEGLPQPKWPLPDLSPPVLDRVRVLGLPRATAYWPCAGTYTTGAINPMQLLIILHTEPGQPLQQVSAHSATREHLQHVRVPQLLHRCKPERYAWLLTTSTPHSQTHFWEAILGNQSPLQTLEARKL